MQCMLYTIDLICLYIQVHAFMNRSNEMSLRLIALDHLGVIAARLRHDAIISIEQDHDELINILAQVYVFAFQCIRSFAGIDCGLFLFVIDVVHIHV